MHNEKVNHLFIACYIFSLPLKLLLPRGIGSSSRDVLLIGIGPLKWIEEACEKSDTIMLT